MPFGQSVLSKRLLSSDDKKRLLVIVSEMKARGIPIPEGLEIPSSTNDLSWNVDDNGYFIKGDGKRFSPRQVLTDFINDESRFILLKSGRGGGKALAIDTPILTYNRGWTTMGDLTLNDYVFDEQGKPSKIVDKSSVMYGHKCYLVTFSDGSAIVADAEHLWQVQNKKQRNGAVLSRFSIMDTESMLPNLTIGHKRERNYSIPTCWPLEYPHAELPLHPYILGAWLGDGSSAGARFTTADPQILNIFTELGLTIKSGSQRYSHSLSFDGTANVRSAKTGRVESNPNNLVSVLRELEVLSNKHIPEMYLRASIQQRLDLLSGLMDTDGYVDDRGHCEFTTTSKSLFAGVLELCLGLGIKAGYFIGRATLYGKDCGEKYRIYLNTELPIFKLDRKLQRLSGSPKQALRHKNRFIESIEVTKSVPVQCISIDSPSHLYLAGRTLIPTHNSASGAQKALKKVMAGQSGAVMNPDFENFRTSTWPELQQWIPWNMVVPKHRYRSSTSWEAIRPFTIVFMNGARIYCKGLKDPESARGANLNWFWYDEGRRDPTGLGWKNAIAFLRIGIKPQAWCTTTMASLDHWTNTFFKGEVTGEIDKLVEELKKSGTDQNLFSVYKTSPRENDAIDPMFLASLLSAYPSGYLRQREIDGEASDEGGSLGTREWFEKKDLQELPDWSVKFTRFWDLAATEQKILKGKKLNDPDETIGTLLGTDKEKDITKKRFVIADQSGGFLAWKQLKEFVLDVTRRDVEKLGMVTVCFEQEPASGGKNQVAELKEFLEKELQKRWGIGTNQVKLESLEAKKLGDRVLAANTWFSEANNGQFFYVRGLWNEKFFGQLDTFDGIRHDDRITSVTGARHQIAPIQKKFGKIDFLSL